MRTQFTNSAITCSLTFQSPDATFIKLHFEIAPIDEGGGENWFETFFAAMYREVFSQASRTIRDLPLLDGVKRLRIYRSGPIPHSVQIADEVERLFKSVGPSVEELIFYCRDMEPSLAPFFDYPKLRDVGQPAVFPR